MTTDPAAEFDRAAALIRRLTAESADPATRPPARVGLARCVAAAAVADQADAALAERPTPEGLAASRRYTAALLTHNAVLAEVNRRLRAELGGEG